MKNKQYLLEQMRGKGLEISQMELINKAWEAWIETLSKEQLMDYLRESIEWAQALGCRLEEMKQIGTPLALKNGTVFTYLLLAVWKSHELEALREQHETPA